MKKRLSVILLSAMLVLVALGTPRVSYAQGTEYTQLEDVYYSLAGCKVYSEPTYTSTVLVELDANLPVRVLGFYSNGWYRINIGVIAYCKMDSLTTAGSIGITSATDDQALAAKQTADELGYGFVYLTLNKEKIIEKDVFNSYVGQKVILFAKIDNNLAVSFKMIYADEVTSDVNLNYTSTATVSGDIRTVEMVPASETELIGQIAIFQFRVGYDKAVDNYIYSINNDQYDLMNTYYTEFSQFAYAPVTQVGNMRIEEYEVTFSLKDSIREKMDNIRKGIKYLKYDESDYRGDIGSSLRKDTEYIDYGV